MTLQGTMELAYELAVRNDLQYPKSRDKNQKASADWLVGFKKRNPHLALRKPVYIFGSYYRIQPSYSE